MSDDINVLNDLIEKANEVIESGKVLTTKTRKALPDSVFCGSGRSFPCQDCAHVRAAKVYLGRSKFSASAKKKIAACINRRAKLLKCEVTKKAKAGVENRYAELLKNEKTLYRSKEFATTKELVEESIKNPDMDLNF